MRMSVPIEDGEGGNLRRCRDVFQRAGRLLCAQRKRCRLVRRIACVLLGIRCAIRIRGRELLDVASKHDKVVDRFMVAWWDRRSDATEVLRVLIGTMLSLVLCLMLCLMLGACARSSDAQVVVVPPASGGESRQDESHKGGDEIATIGGESTVEIEAPAYVVMDALCHVGLMWRALPRVESIESIGEDGQEVLWRVKHRLGVFSGGYVLRWRQDWRDDGSARVDFRVDKRFANDVEDGWGAFRVEPIGAEKTLLLYEVRAVLSDGVLRWMFKEKIQWALLVVPQRVKGIIEGQGGEKPSSMLRLVPVSGKSAESSLFKERLL